MGMQASERSEFIGIHVTPRVKEALLVESKIRKEQKQVPWSVSAIVSQILTEWVEQR